MTIWTPKEPAGIRTHWHPEERGTWKESNILVYSTQLKQVRVVHLENVYRYMHHYLSEEGWKSAEKDARFEVFYGESRDKEGHKEIRWWWRMFRSPGGISGSHAYFRQRCDIDVLTTGMKRIEIMHKGRKIKPYIGEFIMWFHTILELDIHGWFKNHSLLKILEEFWPRMIYKQRVREQEIELRRFSERFVEDLKMFIGLSSRTAGLRTPMEPEKQWY